MDHFQIIEFFTILLLFYVLVFWPWGMWDCSSLTRDRTPTFCIGWWSPNCWTTREIPVVSKALFVCSDGLLEPRNMKRHGKKWPLLSKRTKISFYLWFWDRYRLFSSVQSLSRIWLFVTPWTAARQASLSITNSWSLLKLTSIESLMPSNHLLLRHPLLLPPSIFPSIRVFSNESTLHQVAKGL